MTSCKSSTWKMQWFFRNQTGWLNTIKHLRFWTFHLLDCPNFVASNLNPWMLTRSCYILPIVHVQTVLSTIVGFVNESVSHTFQHHHVACYQNLNTYHITTKPKHLSLTLQQVSKYPDTRSFKGGAAKAFVLWKTPWQTHAIIYMVNRCQYQKTIRHSGIDSTRSQMYLYKCFVALLHFEISIFL